MTNLELEDALFRIISKCKGKKATASISGGKDSAIIYYLCKMAREREPSLDITFIHVNTGMELIASTKWIKQHPDIISLRPTTSMVQHIKLNGVPCVSKLKDEFISRWQRNPESRSGVGAKRILTTGQYSDQAKTGTMAKLNKHLISEIFEKGTDLKISGKCCQYLKKDPMILYNKENNIEVSITGMRKAEGGARSISMKSCFTTDKKGHTKLHPIYDWSNETVEDFIRVYDVRLSDAYTIYGMTRTGCVGCPYGLKVMEELAILQEHEPRSYTKAMLFFKDSYVLKGLIKEDE